MRRLYSSRPEDGLTAISSIPRAGYYTTAIFTASLMFRSNMTFLHVDLGVCGQQPLEDFGIIHDAYERYALVRIHPC